MAGPLRGIRVVELGALGPAPFACMLLADLGADVIKIDRPGATALGVPPELDLLNRGRQSLGVDLKDPAGVSLVRRLASAADIFVEGFRPGVTERLGLGPDALLEANPRLVYGRMTGWGQDGPRAQQAGHDVNFIALTGTLGAIGDEQRPQLPVNLIGDFGGGSLYLVVGVLAALAHVQRTGEGQVVDAAIVDGVAHLSTQLHGLMAAGLWQDRRRSNLIDGGTPFYDVFETSDHAFLAVGPLEPAFYAEFERRLGLDTPLPERTDTAQWAALRERIRSRIAERTRAAWVEIFDGSDACVTPVLSLHEAQRDPHLVERGTFASYDGVVQPAPAPRFSKTPPEQPTAPTPIGSDVGAALARWGLSAD